MTRPVATAPGASEARLTIGEATAIVLDGARPLEAEAVDIAHALGRVAAEPVRAPRDLPPWRNASMDGYAVRAADVAAAAPGAPALLRVVDAIAAGTLPRRGVAPGEAARIMTGAPLPDGADSVIRIEDTDRGTATVTVLDARDAGMNVRPRGEDLHAGDVAVDAGTTITAGVLGVLAAVGAATVRVHRRPRVAILSAGDELVPVADHSRAVAEQRVVDVNAHTIAALVAGCGAEPVVLDLAGDAPAAIAALLRDAPPHDLLVTTGGVSAGDHDHTRGVLRDMGAEILFHRLRIRPGAPLAFGRIGDRRWLGLPGNPVSAMVTFELFARPLLRRLAGAAHVFRATMPVRTTEEIRTAAPLTHLLRVTLRARNDGGWDARLTGPQGSGLVTSMARADALMIVPEDTRVVPAGAELRAFLLGDAPLHAARQVA